MYTASVTAPVVMTRKRSRLRKAVRKTVKWGGAAVTLLLLVAWIGSAWCYVIWEGPGGGYLAVQTGQASYAQPFFGSRWDLSVVWFDSLLPPSMHWWFRFGRWNGGLDLSAPLWLPAIVCLFATASAWRADAEHRRRARVGLCPNCAYDRSGLAAGSVCPECGGAASA